MIRNPKLYSSGTSSSITYCFILILLFFIALALVCFRNIFVFDHPQLFAEDGTWLARGINEGWKTFFLSVRPDYFTWINCLVLFVSFKICTLIFGSINNIVEVIAVVSNAFLALIAILFFSTLRKQTNLRISFFGFFLFLLLPFGNTNNEILGRSLQLGFFCPFLGYLLCFHREDKWKRFFSDVGIFLCIATNPLTIVPVVLTFLPQFFKVKSLKKIINANLFLSLGVSFLVGAISIKMLTSPSITGGIPIGFNIANLWELILAREALYPFVFFTYSHLTNISLTVIALSYFWYLFCGYFYSTGKNREGLGVTLLSFFVVCLATVVMRPGLTIFLDDFTSTFPDRYFITCNLFSLYVFLLSSYALLTKSNCTKKLVIGALILIATIYLSKWKLIFDWPVSKYPMNMFPSFHEQITKVNGEKRLDIQLAPNTPAWRINLPSALIK